MTKFKTCTIVSMKNTIYCPFEVSDNNEVSKYYNKVFLYFLKESKLSEQPKYNKKIKVIVDHFNLFHAFKVIFSKNFFKTLKLIIISNDSKIEKIKQIILLPRSILISKKINQNPTDIIHLFWGHYPSLVILNLDDKIQSKISIFLGAYDFRKKLSISSLAAKRASVIFTHTKKRIIQIKKFLKINIKIICNYRGVQFDEFRKILKYKRLSKIKYSFCTIGVLEKHKNIEMVIHNFYFIKKKYPQAKLYIIGIGSLEKKLKKKVESLNLSKSIIFLGWLAKKNILKILLRTQFYLHFSKVDVIPNSIKEAMYSRCIVLSSKTFAIEEIIDNKKDGFIIDPKNINRILKIIDFCINNSNYAKLIKDKARIKIEKNFDLKKNIKFFVKNFSH